MVTATIGVKITGKVEKKNDSKWEMVKLIDAFLEHQLIYR